jgi:hypothetical protein
MVVWTNPADLSCRHALCQAPENCLSGLVLWTGHVDWSWGLIQWAWSFGLVVWNGPVEGWTSPVGWSWGLVMWIGHVDWSCGLVMWTGPYGLVLWTVPVFWSFRLVQWTCETGPSGWSFGLACEVIVSASPPRTCFVNWTYGPVLHGVGLAD